MLKRLSVAATVVLALVFVAAFSMRGTAEMAGPPLKELTIVTAKNDTYHFSVEIADTPTSREMGLMFRKDMAVDGGMFFWFPSSQVRYFWMKNTLIPLDMLFVDDSGAIVHIVDSAIPQSLTPRGTNIPTRAVVELLGGTAKKLGLAVGDHVFCAPYFVPGDN
ncbi:MAG: DUF192 domain-containing protein [Alphaproteobacteria bacterium]|nr:DUF192 domain-containing protein [Alphaproteobacteria bacterium]